MNGPLTFLFLAAALARAAEAEPQRLQDVTVKPGDTLWSIAQRYLMDPARWDEILKHNKLPSSDPTVALPGMSLKVPVRLIKAHLRAAEMAYVLNRVDSRPRERAQWKPVKQADQVFEGDSVRTLEGSKARVRFLSDDLLNIDANSLVIIKPPAADYDVELKKGGVFVGRSRVITASARITPRTKDTEYSAKVRQDLSTLVEVHKGLASVDAQGQSVDVAAGMATEVKLGLAPAVPKKIADLPEFEARAAEFARARVSGGASSQAAAAVLAPGLAQQTEARDIEAIGVDMEALSIGMPVAGYHVQASPSQQFAKIVFDKTFEADDKPYLKDSLPPGTYWWRIAVIDLLGAEGSFSAPKLYALGGAAPRARQAASPQQPAFVLASPKGDETVYEASYLVKGRVGGDGVNVSINDRPARIDEAGNFQLKVKLEEGENSIVVRAVETDGSSKVLTRVITYEPR